MALSFVERVYLQRIEDEMAQTKGSAFPDILPNRRPKRWRRDVLPDASVGVTLDTNGTIPQAGQLDLF